MAEPRAPSALSRYLDMAAVGKVTAIGMKPRRVVEGCLSGNHRSPFHGFAVEFAGHRQYAPGDDIKHLDWKAYYKSDKYLLKQYQQETNFIAHLLIDVSESMTFEHQYGRKIDYVSFMALALAFLIQDQSDMVSATLFDNRILEHIPRSSAEQVVQKISAAIDRSEKKGPSAIGDVLAHTAENTGRRAIVMVFSDFFGDLDKVADGLKRLLYNKHEVVLFHVLDPVEMDFGLNGTVEFLELEGEDRITIPAHQFRDAYLEEFNKYLTEMKEMSRKLGIEYVRVSMAENFGVVLARYLNERLRMGVQW
jgi:uncharacterized protein (DUF58 family)